MLSTITLRLADRSMFAWCQQQLRSAHYLHRPVDARTSPQAYVVLVDSKLSGCITFGRTQNTRCTGLYGGFDDVARGWAPRTRWEIINLSRLWLDPAIQRGGERYVPNAATRVIAQALARVGYDYLCAHPPVWVDQPWAISHCLSYCSLATHRCVLYRAANFELVRHNREGLLTFMRPLKPLTMQQHTTIKALASANPRSQRLRARAAEAARLEQRTLFASADTYVVVQ